MKSFLRVTTILGLCSTIFLTGCWDRKEINDVAFVMGSSIDYDNDKKLYKVAVQIALPGQLGGAKGGGGGTSGGKTYLMEEAEGETIHNANGKQQKSSSRQLYFAHRRVIVFGEDMAKKGLEPTLDVLGRIPQNRLQSYVLVSHGPADKILDGEAPLEQFPSEMIREMAITSMKKPRSVKHLLNAMLSEGIDVALPTVKLEKQPQGDQSLLTVDGLAVFDSHNKLTGYLSGDEENGALWAMNEANRPEVTVNAPKGKGKIVVRFDQTSTDLEPDIKDDKVTMNIKIQAIGMVIENESDFGLSLAHNYFLLEQQIKKKLESDIKKGIQALQKYNSDAVGFGKTIYGKKPGEWHQLSHKWVETYPKVDVNVNAQVHIEHSGAVVTPLGRKEREIIK